MAPHLPVPELSKEKAFIFRITHVNNLRHILQYGLCCRNSETPNPNFVNIGNPDLIDKRHTRIVPAPGAGTLSDYVPFYFTPHSIMAESIHSGRKGVIRRGNEQIIIFITSLHGIAKDKVNFLFTDRHAYVQGARFFTDLGKLERIDWGILRARDFRRDTEDPGKLERYQAEALIRGILPMSSVNGIACFNEEVRNRVKTLVDAAKLPLHVVCRPGWYF